MEEDEYQSLLKEASGMGHHSSDVDHDQQGVDHHDQEEATVEAAKHAHSDDQANEIEPGKTGLDHAAGHPHEPGQDHANNSGAGAEQAPEQAEEVEVEDHNEHKH
jgi:hypothetical protein